MEDTKGGYITHGGSLPPTGKYTEGSAAEKLGFTSLRARDDGLFYLLRIMAAASKLYARLHFGIH